MARERLIAGIAFAGLGWGLIMAHTHGFSQNPPDVRAATAAAGAQSPLPARDEAQAAIANYCTTCHNERLKTAGLVLDPAGVARPGDESATWEKVLRQLRAGTMPPPGAPRPPPAFYARAAGYLARELEASAAARPNPGSLPLAHRLTRTEYANVVRDLLALADLPKELDYATLLPADNASSGFDNLADTLFVSPATMERYLAAALKISRLAVGDLNMGALVNTHITPVRETQDGRNEALPFGTRGGLQIDGYFPLDAEYEFKVETAGTGAEVHQLEISIDGERKAITNVSRRPGVPAGDDAPNNQGTFRFAVPAGPRSVGVTFDVASIKLSNPDATGKLFTMKGRQVLTINTAAVDLISFAYGVHARQIVGLQPWMTSDRFDVSATPTASGVPNERQLRAMVQSLLADRFRLAFHRETRELPVYALTVATGGPKNLTKNDTNPNGLPGMLFRGLGNLPVSNATFADFVSVMQSAVLDRPVVDRTGLPGRYDFTLNWTADESQFAAMGVRVPPPSGDPNAPPGLFTAIQEQLGLRLESTNAPVGVLMVDRVEKPSEN